VGGWVSRLIQVQNSIAQVFLQRAAERRAAAGDGSVVTSSNDESIEVLQRAQKIARENIWHATVSTERDNATRGEPARVRGIAVIEFAVCSFSALHCRSAVRFCIADAQRIKRLSVCECACISLARCDSP
jgi:hypothetical protein